MKRKQKFVVAAGIAVPDKQAAQVVVDNWASARIDDYLVATCRDPRIEILEVARRRAIPNSRPCKPAAAVSLREDGATVLPATDSLAVRAAIVASAYSATSWYSRWHCLPRRSSLPRGVIPQALG